MLKVQIFYLLLPHFKCVIPTYAISPVIRIIFITENIILVEMVAKKWRMMMIAARLYIYFPYGEISNKGSKKTYTTKSI